MLRFQLDQLFLDLWPNFRERAGLAAAFLVDFEDVIIAGKFYDVAHSSDWQIERDFFQRRGQGLAFDPSPIAALVARAVLGISLRGTGELGAARQLAKDSLDHRFLRRGVTALGMAGDHDHAKLDLLFGGKLIAVRFVIFFNFRGRNNRVSLHVLAPHRLHDHSLGL